MNDNFIKLFTGKNKFKKEEKTELIENVKKFALNNLDNPEDLWTLHYLIEDINDKDFLSDDNLWVLNYIVNN